MASTWCRLSARGSRKVGTVASASSQCWRNQPIASSSSRSMGQLAFGWCERAHTGSTP
jgi:hypothetical protein